MASRKGALKRKRLFQKRKAQRLITRVLGFYARNTSWKVSYNKLSVRDSKLCRILGEKTLLGYIHYVWKIILIDYRSDVISTASHEALHALYPQNSEQKTLQLERLMMRHMTPEEATRLHKSLGRRLR
jgi:DMSO/TMAO reductase YedYZ heme-binding membrane subunit